MLMRRFFTEFPSGLKGTALLSVRVVIGAAFILHGWSKMQNPTGWMDGMGMSTVPAFLQVLAALAEFAGGIALILGLLSRVAAFGLVCQMVAALALVHLPRGDPFVAMGRSSFELPLINLAISFLLVVLGPGRFSLDYLLFGRSVYVAPPKLQEV